MGGTSKIGRIDFDKTVFISNIPFEVRWMDLKDLIREKAGEVSFVEMLETPDGKSKGCAVVEFKDKSGAQRCLDTMHRQSMSGREIVVKEIREPYRFFQKIYDQTGVDFLGGGNRSDHGSSRDPVRRDSIGGGPSMNFETYGLSPTFLNQLGIDGPLSNRVFVANLQYTTTPSRIKEVFSYAGKVTDVDLYLDKDGRSKGISVVEFSHPIEAVQAISMLNNQKYHDRTLIVKMDKHEKPAERRPGEMPPGLVSVGMGLGANGAPLTNVEQVLAAQGGGSAGFGGMTSPTATFTTPGATMYGGGMPGVQAVQAQALGGIQSLAALSTPGVQGPLGGDLTSMNFGNAASRDLADYSRRFDERLSGSFMSNEPFGRSRDVSPPRAVAGGSGWSPMMKAGTQPGCVVIFKNLPANLAWQRLKDFAREVGDCDYAEMSGLDEGRVRYKSPEMAERAIRFFNGRKYEGHTLMVELGR